MDSYFPEGWSPGRVIQLLNSFLREGFVTSDKILGGTMEFDRVSRHQELCLELNKTFEKKNHDYGNSFGESVEEWGIVAAAVRMDDKMRRFKQLAKGSDQLVKGESIRDTLMDLANYAIMTVMEIDNSNRMV